jgi:hypothetical protein
MESREEYLNPGIKSPFLSLLDNLAQLLGALLVLALIFWGMAWVFLALIEATLGSLSFASIFP